MIDNQAPRVNKINKNYVVLVAAILIGGYLLFGFKSIGEKPEFKGFEFPEPKTDVKIEAPEFIKTRSYADLDYASIKPIEKESVIEAPLPEPANPVPDSNTRPYISPTHKRKVHKVKGYRSNNYTPEGYTPELDPEIIADNSPSGWTSGNSRSYAPNNANTGVDYTAMYTQLNDSNMPNTEQLMSGLKNQGQENSRDKFLKNASTHDEIYLQESIETPKSPYQIMGGSIIPCTLIDGINSDLPGDITAQVRGRVYDSVTGQYLLIPHGTKFLGSYDSGVLFGQQRCLFAWKRMIYPDGRSIQLRGMSGADLAGYSGIKDSVDYHYMRLTGAVLMSSFLAIGTEKLDDGNAFRSTMAEDINKSGQKIVDMQLNVQPTIKIAPGTPFNIKVNKDMVLTPYRERG